MDIVAWIGNLGYVVGCVAIARGHPIFGQAVNGIAGILYVIYGISIGAIPMWALSLFLVSINAYGIWNWRKKRDCGQEKRN